MKQLCWLPKLPSVSGAIAGLSFPRRPLSPTRRLCRSAILRGPLQAEESPVNWEELQRHSATSSTSSFSTLVVNNTIPCRIQIDSSTPFLSRREWRHAEEAPQSRKPHQREAKRVVRWHERLHADRCQSPCRLQAPDYVRRAVSGCRTAHGLSKNGALELNVPFQLITPSLKRNILLPHTSPELGLCARILWQTEFNGKVILSRGDDLLFFVV